MDRDWCSSGPRQQAAHAVTLMLASRACQESGPPPDVLLHAWVDYINVLIAAATSWRFGLVVRVHCSRT
jgi:hypothetical protein